MATTDKEMKFKEWFMNSQYNTSEGGYKYTFQNNMFLVRFADENKVLRFMANGKSYKKIGI